MSGQPSDPTTPDEWLPPEPGRNLTPYALGAIGVLLVGGVLRVVQPSLALVLIVVVVGVMSTRHRRENRAHFEGAFVIPPLAHGFRLLQGPHTLAIDRTSIPMTRTPRWCAR